MAGRTRDFYDTLGVAEGASPDEIKRAYRKLAKQFHPDANQGDPKAEERFKEISEAHQVLSDPERRRKYDQLRRFGGTPGFGTRGGATRRPSGGRGFHFEDLSDIGGLGDIFSSIFDFGRRGTGKREEPERGRDVEYRVEIPLRTAALGGHVTIHVPLTEECARCGGSGAAPGARLDACPECHGSGTITFGQGTFSVTRPCPACLGRGRIPTEACEACSGRGEVKTRRKIALSVPAGVDDGSRLRLSGQGERGPGGGPGGDVIVRFRIKPDRFFTRQGRNLVCEVPINLAQAALGSRIRVRTVDGRKVVLRVPPGTQSGTVFRIKGQGIQKGETRGDQLVRVVVQVPDDLSEDGRRALEQLAEAEGLRH